MTTKTKSPSRHFPYQHPTFGRGKTKKHPDSWKRTVYYWWWSYLKRNKEYLSCCEKGGTGKLGSLYKDFGDVRSDDFKTWWSDGDRGAMLFANEATISAVTQLTGGDVVSSDPRVLTISFPLNFPKRFLQAQFRRILTKHHEGRRGTQQAKRNGGANYKFKGQPNIKGLERALKVYDHLEELKAQGVKKPQWKIAMDLNIVDDEFRIHRTDTPKTAEDKRRVLTAIVGRLKKKATDSIKNTGKGLFP